MADYAYALHAPAIGFALVVMSDFSDSASAGGVGWTKGCGVGLELQSAVDPCMPPRLLLSLGISPAVAVGAHRENRRLSRQTCGMRYVDLFETLAIE
jgi:hypothetical protein